MENVEFAPDGSFAFRPGELLVPEEYRERAVTELVSFLGSLGEDVDRESLYPEVSAAGFVKVVGVRHLLAGIEALRRKGIPAQPNHVLFATGACGCGCPPHPSNPRANPYYANPYYANPYYANPYYANPYYANPYYANPYYANPNPGLVGPSGSGERRRSSALPAERPQEFKGFPTAPGHIRVVVLDTGFSDPKYQPNGLNVNSSSDSVDEPDADNDRYLDAAAGHGTFIAGVIQQLTSVCDISVRSVLSSQGDGAEDALSAALEALLAEPPHFVNLSLGGYSVHGMNQLAAAIQALIDAGVVIVASAGNDATCAPLYPAALPGVIGVAALDQQDNPALFSNYGPWVRACTSGVDIVSSFFRAFDGDEVSEGQEPDPDAFDGWAVWSGTSFAAPRVVAALAEVAATTGSTPLEAVERLIDDRDRMRIPMMGTLVMPNGDNWISVRAASQRRDP